MKWIEGKYTNEDRRYNDTSYKCSKCGCITPYPTNFCPDCGERNEEIKEKLKCRLKIK